jgi:hypothetical protein
MSAHLHGTTSDPSTTSYASCVRVCPRRHWCQSCAAAAQLRQQQPQVLVLQLLPPLLPVQLLLVLHLECCWQEPLAAAR